MITEEYKQLLQELGRNRHGQALKALLDEERARLDSVRDCTSVDEIIGRQKALQIIDTIFVFLTERKVDKPSKTRYN